MCEPAVSTSTCRGRRGKARPALRSCAGRKRGRALRGDWTRLARYSRRSALERSQESNIEERIGQVVGGRWTLERTLGSGATAAVYRARDAQGQVAAIKLLLPHMAVEPEVLRRFTQEARVAQRLDHPAIVRMLDHRGSGSDEAYIAFEYLEGETLAARAERQPPEPRELGAIADRVLDALAVAHDQGIVHRDLKPSNVFVTTSGDVKVLDFGVARITASDATAIGTQLGMPIGTTAYMAPEQALGKHDDIDGRTDLFSLGAMLFRILSGEPVHPAQTLTEALQLTATTPARSLGSVAPKLPGELVAIVDMSLAFTQSARYPDARSMQRDLRAWMSGEPLPVASQARESREQATFVPASAGGTPQTGEVAVAPTMVAVSAVTGEQQPSDQHALTELEGTSVPSEVSEAQALIGRTLAGRYRVDALLGTGGMGAVYRAEHVHMKKQVALKVLHKAMTAMPEVVARFEREAVAAARIEHPHVASAKDYGKLEEGSFYLALEYVHGTSLRAVLRRGPLPPERIRTIAAQIVAALAAAHRLGIVHRDLKPENIMLVDRTDGSDFVKVLDFGIAKLTREETAREPQLTQLGTVFGTPQYMSPEQSMGNPVDAKSDIYSVGVILYEMLAGTTPFAADSMMAVLTGHMTQAPPALPAAAPPDLARLTLDLLAKQPEQRPSAEELEQRLLQAPAPPAVKVDYKARLEAVKAAIVSRWDRWAPPLEQRLHRAGLKLPLWVVLLVASGSLFVGVVLVVVLAGDDQAAPSAAAPVPPPPKVPGVNAPAVEPESIPDTVKREVQRIEALPVYKRRYDDWLALARGTAEMGRYKDSTLAYQAVLSLRASMRDDAQLIRDLHRAAFDADSFDLVVNLAATRLKQRGVDLLWVLWHQFRATKGYEEQSELLARKLVVLSRRASRELRTAIELTATENCEKLEATVQRAVKYSDERSLKSLERLQSTDGCGPKHDQDCYSCLRQGAPLEQAIARAKSKPAPKVP